MVSMTVNQLTPSCPPSGPYDNQCQYETGQYIFDVNGCLRKICPSMSRLCSVSKRNFFILLINLFFNKDNSLST
jgi:hypothetical protein